MHNNEELSKIVQKIHQLNKTRYAILKQILHSPGYIAAQVYERYKKCGNKNCKCANGELHGPFMWIYQKKKGQKILSTTVQKELVIKAKKLSGNYQSWTQKRQRLRELEQEIQDLLNEMETYLEQDAKEFATTRKAGRPGKEMLGGKENVEHQ